MKFQLITVAAAFLVASVAALPAPQTEKHGLIPDTDDFVDDGSLNDILARDADANVTIANEAAANFNFTADFDFALDRLLTQIDEIPDDVLQKGDEALHQWLVDHGGRPSDGKLKRDTDEEPNTDTNADAGENLSLLERGELAARASWWKITKCVASILEVLATTAVPAAKILRIKKYIKALGGAKKAVKLLLNNTSKAAKLKAGGKALVKLADELLGISSVKSNCF